LKRACQALAEGKGSIKDVQRELAKVGCAECERGQALRKRMKSLEIVKGQRTASWKQKRRGLVTASQVASILKQNPYETPRALLMKKLDIVVFKGNKFTKHGVVMESAALERYAVETGHEVDEYGLLMDPENDWLAGSPDGITPCGRLIEVKCPVTREIVLGEVPRHYMAQIQTLLHITKLEVCDFVEMKGPNEFQIVEVKRDLDWFATHESELRKFHTKLHEAIENPELAPRPRKRKAKVHAFDFG